MGVDASECTQLIVRGTLHTNAQTIDARAAKGSKRVPVHRGGVTFGRDLGVGRERNVRADGVEQA